ncbi:DUF3078 domain-containing protein [Puia dinghuensis]|uniref:DUF3078 domain-containing protein n=1 Tax=Puia dinghuensis TaxID=1792502 RepID=A0A8J2UGS6_9BACT|nr:DUF3078 domain-containing protein [Puia dinghuensis]GGB13771.1 hypothetical protein GCM10011511_41860 [Puia dinghuensis]
MMKNGSRKSLILFLLTIGLIPCLHAQNNSQALQKEVSGAGITKDPNDTTKMTWKTGGLYNLTFNQAALSNWAAGGDNSALSLNTLLNLYAFYVDGRRSWDNFLTLAYGIANTTSLGTRKTDDRINLTSKYGYDLGKKWYLSGLLDFRSQFAPGYNYPTGKPRVFTSDWLAPAYVLLSIGMDYKPTSNFDVFLSPATARELIVNNDSLAAVGAFGVDSGKKSRFEFGAYASVNYTSNLSKTATYVGRLDLFSDYTKNPQNIALYMTNVLNVKVNSSISMNLALTLIYDDKIRSVKADGTPGGPALQLQEVLGIGLAYKFAKKVRKPAAPPTPPPPAAPPK